MSEERGWLGRMWDKTSAAANVVWNDPGHAAAVFVDGFEQGVADVAGVVIGGIPDLVDYGSEKLFGKDLYEGSAMTAVSDGMVWAVDGAEGLIGIEKPEIRGDGDEIIFGVGRVAGQVTAATVVIAAPGAVLGAAQSTVQGAWTVASTGAKAVHAVSTVVVAAPVIATTGVGIDVGFNDARLTRAAGESVLSWGARKLGYEDLGDVVDDVKEKAGEYVPEVVKETVSDAFNFLAEYPEMTKWGSFGLSLLAGNWMIGGMFGSLLGDNILSKAASLAVSSMFALGISSMISKSLGGHEADKPKDDHAPATAALPAPGLAV